MSETLKHQERPVMLFFVSQCITLFGSQVVQMAVIWYVTLHTQSGAWVAAFSVCSYLPQFFISFLGGVWADRYNRKSMIISADAMIAAVTLIMLLVMPYITAQPAMLTLLLIMSFLRSAGAGIQSPAVNAVIAQIVDPKQRMRYNGIHAAMQSFVQFAAPAAAAVVLTVGSLQTTLTIDILTAALGMGLLACIPIRGENVQKKKTAIFADIRTGIRYAFVRMEIRKLLIIYGAFLFLSVPAGYLAGVFVSRTYGNTYEYLTAVELVGFGGMAAGGVLMSIWGGLGLRRHTLSGGLAVFGLMAIAMGTGIRFSLYLVCMAVFGVALTMVQTAITTMLQQSAEAAMQGRVFGLMSSLYASCYPIGMALFGTMADYIPLTWIMVFSGSALMAVSAAVYFDRVLGESH